MSATPTPAPTSVLITDSWSATTTLWFVYLAERAHDPAIAALLDVLRDVWGVTAVAEPQLSRGRRASRSPA